MIGVVAQPCRPAILPGKGDFLTPEILWLAPTAAILLGYLLGSIPFGVVLTRATGAGDLRTIGSGSIGATNVLRTGRKGLAITTALLDAGKGAVAVLVADWLFPGTGLIAGIAAFLGHLYPVWLGFRGGKGVATLFAVVTALHWPSGLVFAAVWLGLLATVRISSVAGMAAAISVPVSMAFFDRFEMVLPLMGLTLFVLWRHRSNIDRLLAGTEPRIGGSNAG